MGTKLNPAPNDCYDKAEPDEPRFTLIGRDPFAPGLIELWAAMRTGNPFECETAVMNLRRVYEGRTTGERIEDQPKALEALDCATAMRVWRLSNRR